ncbi:MAG: cytochrome c biogenesis protein [Verrucomicrobiota bacterium]|nr:cytochrome c biogenesis protein [Verrucomicrobiota bacterium]
MDRLLLIASTFCFLFAVVRTVMLIRAGVFRPGRSSFIAIAAGFILQTGFLCLRGKAVGRCPLTNLFEVFIFMAWSVALVYMVVGPTYRLSLMGAFTAPFVLLIQTGALLAPIDQPHPPKIAVNPWLEFHASMSVVAYGAFALACVAGAMYLLQERQLKTHHLHSVFHHLPPLTDLFAAIQRLLWWGFGLYTAGLVSGFFTGEPLPRVKIACALAVWCFYGAILQGRHFFRLAPRHVAVLCVVAFTAAVSVLWAITFVSQKTPA